MTNPASARKPKEISLRITRIIDASRELVYRMWTEKYLMDRWSCPEGFVIAQSGAEMKEGGSWHATLRAPDGTDKSLTGVYKEIVPDRRLVFTHAWLDAAGLPGPATTVTVDFADDNGKTRMEFHQTGFDSKASRDGHEGGWTECLGKFEALLDALKGGDGEINIVRVIGGRPWRRSSPPSPIPQALRSGGAPMASRPPRIIWISALAELGPIPCMDPMAPITPTMSPIPRSRPAA